MSIELKKAGYQVNLIAQALDAFYSNYDNTAIPLLEAVRIVSLAQDEEIEKADLYLLKAQKRYRAVKLRIFLSMNLKVAILFSHSYRLPQQILQLVLIRLDFLPHEHDLCPR